MVASHGVDAPCFTCIGDTKMETVGHRIRFDSIAKTDKWCDAPALIAPNTPNAPKVQRCKGALTAVG